MRWTWSFVCDTSCIHVYFHALCYTSYMCDCETYVTCVPSTLIYMSCHFVMLIYFASAFYSDTNELYFVYSYVFHILWVHCVGLDHISMPNPFCFYCQLLIWTKHVENLTHLFYILKVVLLLITKKGEIESIYAPSWVSVINDDTILLWLTYVL